MGSGGDILSGHEEDDALDLKYSKRQRVPIATKIQRSFMRATQKLTLWELLFKFGICAVVIGSIASTIAQALTSMDEKELQSLEHLYDRSWTQKGNWKLKIDEGKDLLPCVFGGVSCTSTYYNGRVTKHVYILDLSCKYQCMEETRNLLRQFTYLVSLSCL